MVRREIVACLLAVVWSACRPQDASEISAEDNNALHSFEPLRKREGRSSICGVESYVTRADIACGVQLFKSAEARACGPDLFKEGTSNACPGSATWDVKEYKTTGTRSSPATTPEACPAGYRQVDERRLERPAGCSRPDVCSHDAVYAYEWTRICQRDAFTASCRLPEFGVERYKTCRHEDNGPELLRSCAREEFGVEQFKVCSYYLNADELRQFIAERRPLVEFMGENLLLSRGNFYADLADEVGMACTIKEFMDDILYEDVTAQLRTGFVTQFGREFVAGSYDCEADKPSVEIESFSCDQNDDARSCRNWRSYVSSKSWLEATATDTVNLLTDIAALTDGRLRSDLESLKSSLASVMESTPNRLDAAIRDELFNSSARENADPRARDVFFEPRRPSNSRQQWEMKKKESTDKGDIFVLANLRNGGVLTYDNGLHMRTEARTRGDDSQHFLLRPTDREGVYYIFNIHKKRYLDSSDADGSYRPSLTTKELDGRKTIKWRVRRGHNGYLIINDVLGLALSI